MRSGPTPALDTMPSPVSSRRKGRPTRPTHSSIRSWTTVSLAVTGPPCNRGSKPGTSRGASMRMTPRSTVRPATRRSSTPIVSRRARPRTASSGVASHRMLAGRPVTRPATWSMTQFSGASSGEVGAAMRPTRVRHRFWRDS
jgi:hypothetical protein